MTVVTCKGNDLFNAADKLKCAECGEGLLPYPFLHWHGAFCLCGKCCQNVKHGLTADLIHVAAIRELRDQGYLNETLTRENAGSAAKRELDKFGR